MRLTIYPTYPHTDSLIRYRIELAGVDHDLGPADAERIKALCHRIERMARKVLSDSFAHLTLPPQEEGGHSWELAVKRGIEKAGKMNDLRDLFGWIRLFDEDTGTGDLAPLGTAQGELSEAKIREWIQGCINRSKNADEARGRIICRAQSVDVREEDGKLWVGVGLSLGRKYEGLFDPTFAPQLSAATPIN